MRLTDFGVSVRDEARMQALNGPTGRAGEEARDDGMNCARQARRHQLAGEGQGDALVFQIGLSDRLGMREEQGSNHFHLQELEGES
jgi:hypothetical protein